MSSLFIPEERAGSVLCQRVREIAGYDLIRDRRRVLKDCSRVLKLTHLVDTKCTVYGLAYGCNELGVRGLLVLTHFPSEVVSGPKEPPNG